MADYGLRTFDAAGNITLETIDKITRFRYKNEVAAGGGGSIDLADISGLLSVEISIGLDITMNGCSHLVTRSDTLISWTAKSGINYVSINSLIFTFLYS